VGIALLVGSIVILAQGFDPVFVYSEMFFGSFGSFPSLAKTVTKTIPLVLIGAGLALAFKAKV
jgi:simple sugar transport system permease protein